MDKKVIQRKEWVSRFNLIGRPKIGNLTFKINERSEKSNWIYNAMSLGIDCGEKFGTIYVDGMGGYSEVNNSVIYAHGKDDKGNDDFKKQIIVDWSDRFNDSVLEEIGSMSFIDVGLEKTTKGNLYVKHFLSMYDAIEYIKDHLSEDMIVNVSGNLAYSVYNDVVQVKKNITSIVLSKVENSSGFKATFTQSVLIDGDSASFNNIDKDKGVVYVDAKVLDYVKEINGVEVKGQYPFNKRFEYAMDFSKESTCKDIMNKLFKPKRGTVTQITVEGDFIEGGAVVTPTIDDLPDDIKELIKLGVFKEEEALAKCTTNGNRERRMVIRHPLIKMVGDEDNKIPFVCIYPEQYQEEDLILDYLHENKDDEIPCNVEDEKEENTHRSDLDWLNALG